MDVLEDKEQSTQQQDIKNEQSSPAEAKCVDHEMVATGVESISPNLAVTFANSSSSSSLSPTYPPPALFVNALNLQPNSRATAETKATNGIKIIKIL